MFWVVFVILLLIYIQAVLWKKVVADTVNKNAEKNISKQNKVLKILEKNKDKCLTRREIIEEINKEFETEYSLDSKTSDYKSFGSVLRKLLEDEKIQKCNDWNPIKYKLKQSAK